MKTKILNKLFGFDSSRMDLKTEILAGLTSFLTMSYILAVNPGMFSMIDGMPRGAVFTTTAIVAVIGTLLIAFLAKMPFGMAPGMGAECLLRIHGMPRDGLQLAIRTHRSPD